MKLQSPLLIGVILLTGLIWANRNSQQESQLAALEQAASPQWAVALTVKPATVALESLELAISVQSARSGYLTLLQRGTDGKESIVFPNALDQANRIEAGQTLILPRDHWKLRAAPPAGEGRLLALVSEQAPELKCVQASLGCAQSIVLGNQPYGAASATYREHQ